MALKIVSPDIAHKTEVAGIRLGLTDQGAVRAAHDDLLETVTNRLPGARIDGVLVQEIISGGVEMILGMILDPQFGPLIMVALVEEILDGCAVELEVRWFLGGATQFEEGGNDVDE